MRVVQGSTVGLLTAVRQTVDGLSRHRRWLWACQCGGLCEKTEWAVSQASNPSCGCLARAAISAARMSHGHSIAARGSLERSTYICWQAMFWRCTNSKRRDYPHYGGRGISVCERWRTYEGFLADMGVKPLPGLSIDRINVNGNYEPQNCRWATPKTQSNNKTNNIHVTLNGRTMTVAEWARELGFDRSTLRLRLQRGLSAEEALLKPTPRMRKASHA